MSSSQNYIDKLTIEYLSSSSYCHNDISASSVDIDPDHIVFYKKRLYAAIKQHINGLIKKLPTTNKDTHDCILTAYIEKKIKAFRIDDFADLQNTDLSNSNIDELPSNYVDDIDDPNKLLYNDTKQTTSTLDDFVIIKTVKTANAPIYPKEKNIMNKNFRYKGVKKKEN